MSRRKQRVLHDRMTKEEILDVMRNDFDSNFRISLDNCVTKAVKEYRKSGDKNSKIVGLFDMIGKSGQQYKFSVHKVYSVVTESAYIGIATYFKVPTERGIAYYTVTSEDSSDYYNFNSETCSVNRYTEHLINRYLERGNGKFRGERGFVEMIAENAYFDTQSLDDGNNGVYGLTVHGSIIGRVVCGKNCFNTFYNSHMTEKGKFSDVSKKIDIFTQRKYMFASMDIKYAAKKFKTGRIIANEYVRTINTVLQKVDDGFYEHTGKQKEQILQEVKEAIEQDAIRTAETLGCAHLQGRPQKLCVQSCIHGMQSRLC